MGENKKVCLSIAGVDPSGGAGVLADVRTFARFGCFPAAAVTSLTFQNTTGVFGAVHQSAETVARQIDAVADDLSVDAVKTGMLPTREVIAAVAERISEWALSPAVIDPVVRSTSGFDLIDDEALAALTEMLFPLASVVTPNVPEAERITGVEIKGPVDTAEAAKRMLDLGAAAVLIKGGHAVGDGEMMIDRLFTASEVTEFAAPRIETTSTHGTGCILAAAITARLAYGDTLTDAIATAKAFVHEAIRTAPGIGRGNGPINI